MAEAGLNKVVTEDIRKSIKLLNALVVLIILCLLFVIIVSLYSPLQNFVLSLPYVSIAVILVSGIAIGLTGLYFARTLARQIIHRIEAYHKRLDTILNITREIKEEIHDDVILGKMISCSIEITDSSAGSILLSEAGNLVYKSAQGVSLQNISGRAIPKDGTMAGQVFRSATPFLSNSIREEDKFDPRIEGFDGYDVESALLVPLRTKRSTLGVMQVCNKKHGSYDQSDLTVIGYLADQTAIALENARFHDNQKNFEIHLTDILLETMDHVFPEKRGHAQRVAHYANTLGKALELPEEQQRRLHFAALLHDIGFLRLSPERRFEKIVYMEHSASGYEMLRPIHLYKDIAPYILHHHEHYDGGGYPEKLKGDDIPVESRIIAIADAFDSMVSEISYQVPVNVDVAFAELKGNAGKQFDPRLVELFVANIEGSLE